MFTVGICSANNMTLENLTATLHKKYPGIRLAAGKTFYWSPAEATVYYKAGDSRPESLWALLHESGHALLSHARYHTDIELVSMEVDAWERAKALAQDLSLDIDEEHIQDCLDSYRDWLHKRSLCPDCTLAGLQIDGYTYTCIFCHKRWQVSTERFCRPYRRLL